MSAEIEIPDGPPWPAALAGGAGTAGRAQSGGVGAGRRPPGAGGGCARPVPRPRSGRRRPYPAAARPRDRGLWYCRLIEPNAWVPARSGPASGKPSESGHRLVMTVLAVQAPPWWERRSGGEPSSRRSTLEVQVTPRGQAGMARDRQPAASTGRVLRTTPDSGRIRFPLSRRSRRSTAMVDAAVIR